MPYVTPSSLVAKPGEAVPDPARLVPPARPRSFTGRLLGGLADLLGGRGTAPIHHGPRAPGKRVALTFDGGPGARTPEHLAVLERHRARATFFALGKASAAHPAAVRAIVAAGHEVASRGYSDTPFPSLEADELSYELAHTAALLPPPPAGERPLVRPPRGAVSLGSVVRCASLGYTTVLWSLDSGDQSATTPGDIAAAVHPTKVRPGDIVLLHESQPATLQALPAIVSALAADGYELVTVSQLLASTR